MERWAAQLAEDALPDEWERVKSSTYTRVAVNTARQLYYKEYLARSPGEALKAAVKGSRATRARRNGEALLLAGIDAPHVIHWGTHPDGREYLFMAAAPGAGINQWLQETLVERKGEQLRQRRDLLQALGTFIGRVHATGFVHGDLRPGNILATQTPDQFRFTLIDNERNTRKTPTPGKLLLRNLMQLNMLPPADLSRTDRMRFFRAWRRQMRELSPVEAKILAAEAYRWALQRLRAHGQL